MHVGLAFVMVIASICGRQDIDHASGSASVIWEHMARSTWSACTARPARMLPASAAGECWTRWPAAEKPASSACKPHMVVS